MRMNGRITLAVGLGWTLLIGCGKSPETPTGDAKPSAQATVDAPGENASPREVSTTKAGGDKDSADPVPEYLATPEAALKELLIAMMLGDEERMRAIALPNQQVEGLRGQEPIPAAESAQFRKFADQRLVVRRLKVGEEFKLGNGQVYQVGEEDAGGNKAMVVQEGAPGITRARRIGGQWRIDATALIAGRRAAIEAQNKRPDTKPADEKQGAAEPQGGDPKDVEKAEQKSPPRQETEQKHD